ncbi:VOC family protein [Sphingosinicella sp. CPCC 101087]|uniref:VOC family protein n=1 Tax=Sphingosinicella sp. CPCC 101087 TaxID=2497754 RepID=UPI00101B83D9|nr:VOC family protein [Sphingosinicella sp. CPCC 101087]
MSVKPAIIPALRYANAPAAIEFLCNAFGFAKHAVYADAKDPEIVSHAQLVLDGNMIMLSSVRDGEYDRKAGLRSVAEAGGNTLGLYVVIDDVDGHAARARAGGADVFMAPEDQDYGGRCYSVRDCEGHVWSFGSYDPWARPE